MRLIDADQLKNDLICFYPEGVPSGLNSETMLKQILQDIDNAPTVIYCGTTSDGVPLMDLRPKPEWIPITTRKLTEEEKSRAAEKYGMDPEDFDDSWMYTCTLPEDGQECLVTTKVWGYVVIDTFRVDEDGAEYFEEHEDEDDLLAWMPLPDPYKGGEDGQ